MTGKGYPKGQLCADRTILGLVCRGSYPDLHTGQNDKRTRHTHCINASLLVSVSHCNYIQYRHSGKLVKSTQDTHTSFFFFF